MHAVAPFATRGIERLDGSLVKAAPGTEGEILAALADGTVTSAGEIIDRFQTDKSAVSRQLRQLEELGLVESRPDPVDRRARVLAVTDLARERIAAARSDREARLGARLDAWSADDLELVSALLRDLAR